MIGDETISHDSTVFTFSLLNYIINMPINMSKNQYCCSILIGISPELHSL